MATVGGRPGISISDHQSGRLLTAVGSVERVIREHIVEILSGFAVALAVFGLVHQRLSTQAGWFSWEQFLNHEALIVVCLISAAGLLLGKYLNKTHCNSC